MNKRKYKNEFEDWMIGSLRGHIEEGWSVNTWPNRHKVSPQSFAIWLREIPSLREINQQYKMSIPRNRRGKL